MGFRLRRVSPSTLFAEDASAVEQLHMASAASVANPTRGKRRSTRNLRFRETDTIKYRKYGISGPPPPPPPPPQLADSVEAAQTRRSCKYDLEP